MKYWKKVFAVAVATMGFVGLYLTFYETPLYGIKKELPSLQTVSLVESVRLVNNAVESKTIPIPSDITSKCTDSVCSAALSADEMVSFTVCKSLVQNMTKVDAALIKPSCKFMDGRSRKVVALVSETGSGNTWVRGLLERVTGICTGAIYCDPALRNSGMVGEFVVGPSVLVVKTHTPDYQWEGVAHPDRRADPHHNDGYYASAILLVRNPFDAFVSEWNRFVTVQKSKKNVSARGVTDESHTYSLGKEMFGSNHEWNQFLLSICIRWYNLYTRWFSSGISNEIPILVVHYEDVKHDKISELEKMLTFLHYDFDHDAISITLRRDFQTFQRSHGDQFEHYTVKQKNKVNKIILKAAHFLRAYDKHNIFALERYLRL